MRSRLSSSHTCPAVPPGPRRPRRQPPATGRCSARHPPSARELVPRALPGLSRERILGTASRGAHRGHEEAQQREDRQTRCLDEIDAQRIERRSEGVREGQRGQAPREQRGPKPAHPARDHDRGQGQLARRHHGRPQQQRETNGGRHAQNGEAVSAEPAIAERAPSGVEETSLNPPSSSADTATAVLDGREPTCVDRSLAGEAGLPYLRRVRSGALRELLGSCQG
jgi:hypothetical protein